MLEGCSEGCRGQTEQTCGSTGEQGSLAAAITKLFVQARPMAIIPMEGRVPCRGWQARPPAAAGPRAGGAPYPAPYPALGARAEPPRGALSNTAPFQARGIGRKL